MGVNIQTAINLILELDKKITPHQLQDLSEMSYFNGESLILRAKNFRNSSYIITLKSLKNDSILKFIYKYRGVCELEKTAHYNLNFHDPVVHFRRLKLALAETLLEN